MSSMTLSSHSHYFPKGAMDYHAYYLGHCTDLFKCYCAMIAISQRSVIVIDFENFVELRMRFLSISNADFWDSLVFYRIVVRDCFLHYQYSLFSSVHPVIPMLSQPIQLVNRDLPGQGWHKLYCDGSFKAGHAVHGGGIVMVSSTGDVQMWCTKFLSCSAVESELIVQLRGIEIAMQSGVKKLILVSDCLDVVDIMTGRAFPRPILRSAFCEFLERLHRFEGWDIRHIPREGMELADGISKHPMLAIMTHVILEFDDNMLSVELKAEKEKLEKELPALRIESIKSASQTKRYAPRNNLTKIVGLPI